MNPNLSRGREAAMPRQSVFDMAFAKVYQALINKAERKGRTRAEVNEVTCWLTGYQPDQLETLMASDATYGAFLEQAPAYHPASDLITGKVCGVQVETIADPLTKRMRQLDKLVDELAKGRPMEKVLRS